MPNLVGYWNPSARRQEAIDVCDRQVAAIQCGFHRFRESRIIGTCWCAAHLDHGILEVGEQPATSDDGRISILIDGEILNLFEVSRDAVPNTVGRATEPAKVCANAIAKAGLNVAVRFSGAYALVIWDVVEQSLSLVTDRLGMRSVFMRRVGESVAFATELKGVIAAHQCKNRIDTVAVCEQLVYGNHFGGRTWISGCHRLPPATITVLKKEAITQTRYWKYQYRYESAATARNVESCATQFAILLDRAVDRCMRGTRRIGVFLSGGYDSRSVAASIRRSYLPLPAFTFGEPSARDMLIAPMLAKRLGLQHVPIPAAKPYLVDIAPKVVWRTEGLLPFTTASSLQNHEQIVAHAEIILTGCLGEFSGSHTWPRLLLANSRRKAIAAIFNRFVAHRLGVLRSIIAPSVLPGALEELRERFFESFESIDCDHPLDLADAWNFTFLQPNGTFQVASVDRHRFEMRAPHCDTDLVDFLLTIPPKIRLEQRVYKKMLAAAYPRIRDIPCANSMRPVEPRFWLEYPQLIAEYLFRRAVEPIARSLGRSDTLGREINDLDADFRSEPCLRNLVLQPLIDDRWLDPSVFYTDGLIKLAESQFTGAQQHARVLSSVISIGMACRMLLGGEIQDVPPRYREQQITVGTELGHA